MKTTADTLRFLLPTLQHLARFPGANVRAIASRNGHSAEEVETVIRDLTDGVSSRWDEEFLADIASRLEVELPVFTPRALSANAGTAGRPPPRPVSVAAIPSLPSPSAAVVKPAPAKTPEAPRPRRTKPAAPAAAQPSTMDRIVAVARDLAKDVGYELTEKEVCARHGLSPSAWSTWKGNTFGAGRAATEQLQAFVDGDRKPLRGGAKASVKRAAAVKTKAAKRTARRKAKATRFAPGDALAVARKAEAACANPEALLALLTGHTLRFEIRLVRSGN